MYKRGPYYQRKRYFPLFPKESMALTAAVVLGAAGLIGLASRSDVRTGVTDAYHSWRSNWNGRNKRNEELKPLTNIAKTPATAPANTATGSVGAVTGSLLDLSSPLKKEAAMRLVSSAENSSLDWRTQYKYIEDIGDGRGYTAGIIGFCSGTGDMLELVEYYTSIQPNNALAAYLPALRKVNGTASHAGLGDAFVAAWQKSAADPLFQAAQDHERDRVYFNPAVTQAKADGLHALGQFAYYDAMVMHGPGNDAVSFGGIRAAALKKARTPAQGGDEKAYLSAFMDARAAAMRTEEAHSDSSRVDTAQRVFLNNGNLNLELPLSWSVYGDLFTVTSISL